MKIIIYIYVLLNNINNKLYIGQTCNFQRRKRQYISRINETRPIAHAIKKYGFNCFDMFIIESHSNKQKADNSEIFWIKLLKTTNKKYGYNISNGGMDRSAWKKKAHRDKMSKITSSHNMAGHNSPSANWTSIEINEMRQKFLTLKFSIYDLTKIYNCPYGTMYDIIKNKHYFDNSYILSDEFNKQYYKIHARSRKSKYNHAYKIVDNTGNLFNSIREAAKYYNLSPDTVSKILRTGYASPQIINKFGKLTFTKLQ